MRTCSGCCGSRYVSVGHPFATQASSIAACLPEQFMNSGRFVSPARMTASLAPESSGQSRGHCSAASGSWAWASRPRTTDRWAGVPPWLAVASTAAGPSSGTPAPMTAIAWNGFMLERGKIRAFGLPRARTTVPSGPSTTAEPRCLDSAKPFRSTRASSTASAPVKVPSDGVPRVTGLRRRRRAPRRRRRSVRS